MGSFVERMSYSDTAMRENQLLPEKFGRSGRSNLRRFVVAPDLGFRSGYGRFEKGETSESYFWYDEFWAVLQGTAHLHTIVKADGQVQEEDWDLKPMDLLFLPKGVRFQKVITSDEPFVNFYCAIPASSKESAWLANLSMEDIAEIRARSS